VDRGETREHMLQ
jgi:hypothetical protein